MWILENEYLRIGITALGAELTEIYFKPFGIHYLWSGDAAVWGRKAPVLFPIVGKLKDNRYVYKGVTYTLPQHGFARDQSFSLIQLTENEIVLSLKADATTLSVYPFQFELQIQYQIEKQKVITTYKVVNLEEKEVMFYSIGAHPGFTCPLLEGERFTDYQLVFNTTEVLDRVLLENGLRSTQKERVKLREDGRTLPLDATLFEVKDAIVLQGIKSECIRLESKRHQHGVEFTFTQYPWFGIWSKPGPFICLEPWMGVADSVSSSGKLEEKEGIRSLLPKANESFSFTIDIF
ncbi:MAG: aldose 1-epimerase family protein [Cytophagaceae bacterium]|jgi:galactose mutarotase-like enzyme|nr:aldose 1-epimerase family protein [Cytophagaceae bacterium]